MKEKSYKKSIVYLFGFILTGYLFSCETRLSDDRHTVRVFFQTIRPDIPENDMDYYYAVFQAGFKGHEGLKDIPDSEYELILKSDKALSKKELDTLSFQFQNYEIEQKAFKILVLATPSGLNETCLARISGSKPEYGDPFSEICISMIPDGESGYRILSKDNYYAGQTILGKDIISNEILKINAKLERVVGQLVFDIFKMENDILHPVDTEQGIGSVLDRVKKIDIRTTSFSCIYPLSKGISISTSENDTIHVGFETILDPEDKCLYVSEQDPGNIEGPLSKDGYPGIRGSVRIHGPYLLPAYLKSVRTSLVFTYFDTTQANGEYEMKDMSLFLPAANSNLFVKENCYSVTNIGISQNRIIDLDVSGGISILPGWE